MADFTSPPQWLRGLAAKIAASTAVADKAALVTSDDGHGWISDGTTAIKDKARLADLEDLQDYAPTVAGRPGNRCVFLGDSITYGSDDNPNNNRGMSWPNLASIISGQRLNYIYNAGVPGDNAAGMLARFDTAVTPHAPNVVVLLAGTNDLPATAFGSYSTSMKAIVAKIRGIGAVPVMCTIPPSNTARSHQKITAWNLWIRRYAAANGITVIDFYTLLADPTNGNYKTGYFNDGTHPNVAGTIAMGTLAAAVLTPLLPNCPPFLCSDDVDPSNNIASGTFAGASGTALPSGWIDFAGTPSGSALSYVTDSAVPGQMLKITQTAVASGTRQVAYQQYVGATTLSASTSAGDTTLTLPARADYRGTLFIGSGATFEIVKILSSSGGGPQTETLVAPLLYAHAAGEQVICNAAPGDLVLYSGVITTDGGVPFQVDVQCVGAAYSAGPISGTLQPALTRGVWAQEFTVPAATTQMICRIRADAGTGTVAFGQIGIYNLTRLGLLV